MIRDRDVHVQSVSDRQRKGKPQRMSSYAKKPALQKKILCINPVLQVEHCKSRKKEGYEMHHFFLL